MLVNSMMSLALLAHLSYRCTVSTSAVDGLAMKSLMFTNHIHGL